MCCRLRPREAISRRIVFASLGQDGINRRRKAETLINGEFAPLDGPQIIDVLAFAGESGEWGNRYASIAGAGEIDRQHVFGCGANFLAGEFGVGSHQRPEAQNRYQQIFHRLRQRECSKASHLTATRADRSQQPILPVASRALANSLPKIGQRACKILEMMQK